MNPTDITNYTPEKKKLFQERLDQGLTPITSESLTNASSLVISTPEPSINPAVSIIASSQATTDALKQAEEETAKLNAPVQQAQAKQQSTLESVRSMFGLASSAQAEALKAEETITPERKALADINTQIADYTVQYRAESDAVKTRGDITQTGQQSLQSNVDAKYGRILADLAIRQSAANQNVTALQAAADRKLALTLAPIQNEIDYLTKFQLENDKLLTQDEKDRVTQMLSEKDKILKTRTEEQNIANTALKTAMENGVKIPDSVVSQVLANPSQAYTILATNGIALQDPLDRRKKLLELEKLGVEIDKTRLENIAKEVGATSPYQKERQVRTLQSVEELRKRVNFQTVGIVGAIGKYAPASLPRNFRTDLDTLKATIAFGELTAMREASKTGGALGQVSNVELGLLESALGGLDQGQSPANFRKNLDKIEASIKRWQGAANATSEEDQLRALGYTEEQIQQIKASQ